MANYRIGEVTIEGGYPVRELLELSMDIGANHHGRLTYGGLVEESDAMKLIEQKAEGQRVRVYLGGILEFCGCPQEITAEYANSHCYLRVALASCSALADIEPHDRFFQGGEGEIGGILAEAFGDSGLGSAFAAQGMARIGGPVLQYRETDWQLMLRLAGSLGAAVIPNVASDEPQATIGIPERRATEEPCDAPYEAGRRGGHLSYSMKSENRYRLGDSVAVGGTALAVMEKRIDLEQGRLDETYVLGTGQGFAAPRRRNGRIAGLELEGRVMARHAQSMAVLLDIDSGRSGSGGGKAWFDYAPVSNNGMYSMPLIGEKVMLQWQSDSDGDALVVRAVRGNGRDMPHHSGRHFETEHDSHLMMAPGVVGLANPAGSIHWLAGSGFGISSAEYISLAAESDIVIRSEAQVRLYAQERITAGKAGAESSLDMLCSELHIKAAEDVVVRSKTDTHRQASLPVLAAGSATLIAAVLRNMTAIPNRSGLASNAQGTPNAITERDPNAVQPLMINPVKAAASGFAQIPGAEPASKGGVAADTVALSARNGPQLGNDIAYFRTVLESGRSIPDFESIIRYTNDGGAWTVTDRNGEVRSVRGLYTQGYRLEWEHTPPRMYNPTSLTEEGFGKMAYYRKRAAGIEIARPPNPHSTYWHSGTMAYLESVIDDACCVIDPKMLFEALGIDGMPNRYMTLVDKYEVYIGSNRIVIDKLSHRDLILDNVYIRDVYDKLGGVLGFELEWDNHRKAAKITFALDVVAPTAVSVSDAGGGDAVSVTSLDSRGLNMIANMERSIYAEKDILYDEATGTIIRIPTLGNDVGYGHDVTQRPMSPVPEFLTAEEALELLKVDVQGDNEGIARIDASFTQDQFNALVSLRYNIGAIGNIIGLLPYLEENDGYERAAMRALIIGHYDKIIANDPRQAANKDGWYYRTDRMLDIFFDGIYGPMPIDAVNGKVLLDGE